MFENWKKGKGKLPFKCFNCGGVGHFKSKYPLKGNNENNDESYIEKGDKKKSFFKKGNSSQRSFLSKNKSSWENSLYENSEEETREALFMAFLMRN